MALVDVEVVEHVAFDRVDRTERRIALDEPDRLAVDRRDVDERLAPFDPLPDVRGRQIEVGIALVEAPIQIEQPADRFDVDRRGCSISIIAAQ